MWCVLSVSLCLVGCGVVRVCLIQSEGRVIRKILFKFTHIEINCLLKCKKFVIEVIHSIFLNTILYI